MNGFEKVKKKKKQAIKAAALELFSKHGYKDVKIEAIAKQAKVSQVTIYNHFGSKDALFHELIQEFTIQEVHYYEELLTSDLSFQEKMQRIMTRKLQSIQRLHPEMIEQAMQTDEELRNFLFTYQNEKALPLFLRFIEEAQQKEEINPHLSKDMILLYINMFSKMSDQFVTHLIGEDREQQTKKILTMFFYGLSNPN
ncbi:TetR/AcrR family transcriptional regulator [Bacillus sp. 123MFChir2]|uniref:TetR/AcrR family transcriptional regulator n=1 Tax=Bacillus sp. 123MFChir2 TaxID=1169144 RepID=UPI00036E9326|nr:TetR/AcrR family transcriptional regulator [Bacillus sp. 123MFChir2]